MAQKSGRPGLNKWEFGILAAAVAAAGLFIARKLPNTSAALPLILLPLLFLAAVFFFPEKTGAILSGCFRYRWLIALALFVLCVLLTLHGSSIGVYRVLFPTQITQEETTVWGVSRWVRSDEYGVATPTYFSQAFNSGSFYSTRMSVGPTNMVLDYYSPVWDLTVIGKPLAWGFLLLGNEYGLSWYWCGLEILLFMTALEMCLVVARGRKGEALLGAFLIGFSPYIQWWIMPHMPLVVMYAMGLFGIGYWFFTAESRAARIGSAVLAVVAVVGFVLTLFPSYQVPCGLTVLILLVICLIRDKDRFRFGKRDIPRLVIPAVAVLGILGLFFWRSRGDIALLTGTVYPGQVTERGGTRFYWDLFTSPGSLFFSFGDLPYANNCEESTYLHFAPFFLLLMPRMCRFLKKKQDGGAAVGKLLAVLLVIEGAFMIVRIPGFLAKITLLSFCNRMPGIYGWTAVIFTVWGVANLFRYPEMLRRSEKIVYTAVYAVLSYLMIDTRLTEYWQLIRVRGITLGDWTGILILAGLAALLALAVWGRRALFLGMTALLVFVAGATVNPVERGTGAITNHPVSALISELSGEEPDSSWLCTDVDFFVANFVMANGARVLNATNFYPDVEKWAAIDPEGLYEEATNRYANQRAVLTEEETSVTLLRADHIQLNLNPEMLKQLGVHYLFGPVDHTELLAAHGIACTYAGGQDGFGIWRLDYADPS